MSAMSSIIPAREGWRAAFVWRRKNGDIEIDTAKIACWKLGEADLGETIEGFIAVDMSMKPASMQEHFQCFLPPEARGEEDLRAVIREHMEVKA